MARVLVMHVRSGDQEPHIEKYVVGGPGTSPKEGDDLEKWARGVIKYFNDTIKPHEKPRTLIGVEVVEDEKARTAHQWVKVSITTVYERGRIFDRMRCETCEITGKRFGLGPATIPDSKFRGRAFQTCNTAQALLNKRAGYAEAK